MNQSDILWTIISLIFTLMIFSYILGDNFLFRIATYIFVGVSSAYVAVLLLQSIIIPKLLMPFLSGNINTILFTIVPLLLSGMLIFKLFPKTNRLGTLPMAIIVGAGVGVMLTGSILGTLIPQTTSTFNFASSGWFTGFILLIGTVTTLLYFQFTTKKQIQAIEQKQNFMFYLNQVGGGFIAIALGSIFAGIILSAILALITRFTFIMQFFSSIMNG
jgi:hypothetical protein